MRFLYIILTCEDKAFTYNQEWVNMGYLVSAINDISNLSVDVRFCMIDKTEELLKELKDNMPDFIAMPVLQYSAMPAMRLIKEIKKICNTVKIILGNKEVTLIPEYYMKHYQDIDIIIIGEGEATTRELVEKLIKNEEIDSCKGIYYRKGDTICKTEERPLIQDLDSIKFPNKDFYPYALADHKLICSRGCRGACTFCAYENRGIRYRSIGNIIDEMEYVQKKYSGNYFDIHDSTFGDGYDDVSCYLNEFYEAIVERKLNIRFQFNMRCEQITEESIRALKKLCFVGLDMIFIGVESGNEHDLRLYGKRAKLKDNYNAVKLLKEVGINFSYGYIMFNPYSTIELLEKDMNFLLENNLDFELVTITSRIQIYTGTPLVKKIARDGLLIGSIDEPIVDCFDYRFQDERVGIIWGYLNKVCMELDKRVPHYVVTSALEFINDMKYGHGMDCEKLEKLLFNYKQLQKDYAQQLFKKAVLLSECNSLNEEFKYEEYIQRIEDMYNSIKLEKYRVLKQSYKNAK